MEKKKNVPRLRFPGFADEWEQRKLGTICERVTRKNKNFESDLPLTIASQYGLIDQRNFFNKVVAAKDMSNYYLLKRGEFAYNKSYSNGFDYGSIKRLNAYEQGCLSTLYICFALISDDVGSDYLECYFDTLRWYDDVSQICAEGARNHGLLNVDTKAFFDDVSIGMPSTKMEQKQIAAFLGNFDNLITLHKRKLDSMKQYKQGMLQKMFPKEGEKTPKIRFPGFTTNWDSVCLGDLYKERNERGNDNLPILSVSIHTGVSGGELDTEELGKNVRRSEDKSLYKRVYSGDLVFNMMRAWQGAIGVVKNEGMVSPAYISAVPNERVYPPFMDYLLRRNEVINQINNLSYGVTDFRKRLYWDSFVQVGVCLPSLEEQMMITALFQEMDSYLSVNQKKVNQMLQYKQGLLQQMFV